MRVIEDSLGGVLRGAACEIPPSAVYRIAMGIRRYRGPVMCQWKVSLTYHSFLAHDNVSY